MARSINVLLVADEGLTRSVAVNGLEMYRYSVATARHGEDAVAQLSARTRIEVLVVDADLVGDCTGLKAAQKARELRPAIDVIYVSSNPYRILPNQLVRGAPCIRSPYHPHQLASVISALRCRPGLDGDGEVAYAA